MTKYIAELVGTFILVYAIASAATVYRNSGQLGVIGIGLVHAFVLAAIVYAISYKSGAHVNPAVTIGMLVAGKIKPKEASMYIVCQIIGAIVAAAVVYSIFGQSMGASVTLPAESNVTRAFILEMVMTFTLVYVIMATTTDKNFKIAPLAGVAIGFTLGLNVIFGGSITGGSLNPARSFGPALIAGNFRFHWIYWAAPIIGGIIAAAVYKFLHKDTELPSEEESSVDKELKLHKKINDLIVNSSSQPNYNNSSENSKAIKEEIARAIKEERAKASQRGITRTTIPVIEERMNISKKVSTTEEATITKEPITETKTLQVPVTHEEIRIERRRPASDTTTAVVGPVQSKTEIKVPLNVEKLEVSKQPYVKEELVLTKERVTEVKTISDTVRSEKVDMSGIKEEERKESMDKEE